MPAHPARDAAQEDLQLLLQRMERLMEIGHTLASTLDQAKLMRRIVDAARELTDTEASSLLLLDAATGELRFEATTNVLASDLDGTSVPVDDSISGWVVQHNEPLLVPDTQSDARWNPQFDELTAFATRSMLAVPLAARQRTLGVLEVLNKRGGAFSAGDLRDLTWLAAQGATAIVNARLFHQSHLVAEMVHELRTPLAALMATSHLLLRPELDGQQRHDIILTLQRETERLAQLTTDFLDMARLESGRVRFTFATFDLAALLQECRAIIQPKAAERAIEVTVETATYLPPLQTDRDKLKQVVLNLLTNAVKYNRDQGRVVARAEADPSVFRVFVEDTGPGLAPEALERVYDPFYRDPASERTAEGTGLGLPIAKRIVEALGGEIGVQSRPGQGSTFYFTLPPTPHKTVPLAD
ncbi:MAG: GAF domain-containing sensor histidine kinase [Anaerolineales bacterium]|nr:GAF domain-containing sensor histidine kinase [Anaerolineales bacterium]